jgi:ubiquinone/menaquinone biosynthesis C-methylase UbiE
MYNFDITRIPFPENSFDVIYCSHVLEHVPDDRKAMREFLRILRIGGWALLQVPITGTRTFEDPSITDPYERRRLFGQEDHVRRYGPDYKNRLEEAGFKVTSYRASDLIENEEDYYRIGIQKNRMIFFCEKL